ncbi:MAG: hypothetical protein QXF25_00775 [Candidatus Pacearchaeota archaeon]
MKEQTLKHKHKTQEEVKERKKPTLSLVQKPDEKTSSQVWQELSNTPETFRAKGLYTPNQLNGWFNAITSYREPSLRISLTIANERIDIYLMKGKSLTHWQGDAPYFIYGINTNRDWRNKISTLSPREQQRLQYLQLAEKQITEMFNEGNVTLEGSVVDLEHAIFEENPSFTPELSFTQFLLSLYQTLVSLKEVKPAEEFFFGKLYRIAEQLPSYAQVAHELQSLLIEIALSSQTGSVSFLIDKSNQKPRVVGVNSKRTQEKKEELARYKHKSKFVLEELARDIFDIDKNKPVVIQGRVLHSLPNSYIILDENTHGIESVAFFMDLCRSYDEYVSLRKKVFAPLQKTSAPRASLLRKVYNAILGKDSR